MHYSAQFYAILCCSSLFFATFRSPALLFAILRYFPLLCDKHLVTLRIVPSPNQFIVRCPDEPHHLVTPGALYRRGLNDQRQLVPAFRQVFLHLFDCLEPFFLTDLIALGIEQYERQLAVAEPVDEIEVKLLWRDPAVDQHEKAHQVGPVNGILLDHFGKSLALFLRYLGVPVAGQVAQVPAVIDQEMVDQSCFPGCGRCFRQVFPLHQHIDERAFPHVRSPDKRIFRQVPLRTLCNGLR